MSALLAHSNFLQETKTCDFTFCLQPKTYGHSCAFVRPIRTYRSLTPLFSTAIHSTSNVSTIQGNHPGADSTTTIPEHVQLSESYVRHIPSVHFDSAALSMTSATVSHMTVTTSFRLAKSDFVPFYNFAVHRAFSYFRYPMFFPFMLTNFPLNIYLKYFTEYNQ
jgi:hypothetical protein